MSRLRPLLVFGTRPEAIKLAPLIHAGQSRPDDVDLRVCVTGQHREMLKQVLDYFQIEPHLDLALMQPNQTLATLTARCLSAVNEVLERDRPDCMVVQGDTTTAFAASLAAFYQRVPVVHVEAGLRTGNLQSPWPEEFNRRVTSLVTSLHCAPTQRSAENLRREGIPADRIHVTGNTVVDALLWTVERERGSADRWQQKYGYLGSARLVLITGHRRENFGGPFREVCQAIVGLARAFPDVQFLYPVHLNPHVREPVFEILGHDRNVHLADPVPYPEFVWLMDRSTLILSDSGGVQEEAPTLRKPVLVMRDTTERPEAVEAGAVELVGTSREQIVMRATALLTDDAEYRRHQIEQNPYGDGRSADRILDLMQRMAGSPA